MASNNETVNKIVKILDGKKGRDIEVINISELTTMADYFVIVTGGSDTQVKALCDNLEEELEKDGIVPVNKEGYRTAQWILLAYDEVIVHIFLEETREFYSLERVWKDGLRVDVSDLLVK
ncbi:MAG TPA: ribosome silencing factor [Candidatus Monoglobus merdigallinarum]|uniref:Ribosomal silencing factor RsfS n=1 Tax=Candidatus Monoglobus merdigallinarum TaxID=2838698 RepID=A0A9D1PR72_9FIRM|nr:ribosome silencing factor [Candidatus Monoglobus merdigallinarum]